jgi:tRNA U55 pseudouridine synthase TruB
MATTNNEKKQYVKEYIRSLAAIEGCIEPYQEQKRELRSEFRENNWLNTDEIRAAVKAYRLFKGKFNIDEVVENFEMISGEADDS